MNAEAIKAMNNQKKKHPIHEWWNKNRDKIMRMILAPIWWYIKAEEKIEARLNSKCEWSDERAQEILNYYIPRVAEWNEENKSFYFADNGRGWHLKYRKKKLKLRDRRWWSYNCGCWGGQIRTYLIEKFEMEGFEKSVGDTYGCRTKIIFKMIEKPLDK